MAHHPDGPSVDRRLDDVDVEDPPLASASQMGSKARDPLIGRATTQGNGGADHPSHDQQCGHHHGWAGRGDREHQRGQAHRGGDQAHLARSPPGDVAPALKWAKPVVPLRLSIRHRRGPQVEPVG